MFTDNAHSLAMVAHAITVITAAVKHLNPSQIPVISVDQPLFALAKQIQWSVGGSFDEDHAVFLLGGLHIEMAAFKALGRWVDGSGWTQALVNASRTRRAHQLTRKAYAEYFESYESKGKSQTLNEWKEEKLKKCPQFLYWATVVDLELLCL